MFNIPNTTAVTWTTPPVSTPVGPVAPVQPVGATGRERQAGLGTGQDGQPPARPKLAARTEPGAVGQETAAAPLLPRAAQDKGAEAERAREASLRQEEQQKAAQELAEQEADKALREKLQAVLTTIWQASAAVVERALGREPANETPGARADAMSASGATGSSQSARRPLPPEPAERSQTEPLPWPVLQGGAGRVGDSPVPAALPPEEIVAYDDRGNTSAAPLEVGSLINRRV